MAAMWLYIPSTMELECFNNLGGYSGTHGIHLSLVWCWISLCMVNYGSECFSQPLNFQTTAENCGQCNSLDYNRTFLSFLDLRVLSHYQLWCSPRFAWHQSLVILWMMWTLFPDSGAHRWAVPESAIKKVFWGMIDVNLGTVCFWYESNHPK